MSYNRKHQETIFQDIWMKGEDCSFILNAHEDWMQRWQNERQRLIKAGFEANNGKAHDEFMGEIRSWWEEQRKSVSHSRRLRTSI